MDDFDPNDYEDDEFDSDDFDSNDYERHSEGGNNDFESDDFDSNDYERCSEGGKMDTSIREQNMVGEDEIPNSSDVTDDYSEDDDYSYDLTQDPRPSDVEDQTLLSEEDLINNRDWICMLTDDEKEGEMTESDDDSS